MAHRTNIEELAFRTGDGVEVSLVWHRRENRLTVLVCDSRRGGAFEIAVERENALDAFHHPYAYAAFRGIDYFAPAA